MSTILIYVTCTDKAEAQALSRTLVEERLAACANIFPSHDSVYRWEGKIEQTQEVVVILKTRESLFEQVKDRICALHSYECPCILAIPVEKGHAPFLEWIEKETL